MMVVGDGLSGDEGRVDTACFTALVFLYKRFVVSIPSSPNLFA